jgi:hypothetical protein
LKYLKEFLVGQYNWPVENGTMYTGVPSRRIFDRSNGNQILFIINCFYDSIGYNSDNTGKKLEELISTQLPQEMKSELAVFNWLKGVYMYQSEQTSL